MGNVTVETHVDDALGRVEREIEHFEDRGAAVERFRRELDSIQPATAQPRAATDGGVGAVSPVTAGGASQCKEVRKLFAETVYRHSVTDGEESLLQTIGEEFSEPISFALAPGTDQRFTPPVKQSVRSAASERLVEIESMQRALDAERESLRAAREGIEEITDWLCEADQTPLLELDFEALRARHDRLEEYRQRCDRLARARQERVHSTTSQAGAAGVDHHQLVEFLYQSFPVSHPVLGTLTNLDDVCEECQRRVRDHMIRRV